MKAPVRLFANAPSGLSAARVLACTAACAVLAGCIGNPFDAAKVDPKSPIAKDVAAATRTERSYPSFTDIPPVPKDVRPKAQYGVQAAAVETTAAALDAATAPGTWTLQKSDTFANTARQAAGPDLPPVDPAVTEAFAKDLRKRATPPPPPKH